MENLVFKSNDGQPVTNSLLVAEKFEKEHKNVLRDIRNLVAQNCAVRNLFVETTYVSERGCDEPLFVMGRDGFSLLVMGFTGEKALQFKLDFINAFNRMEEMLTAIASNKGRLFDNSARRRYLLATEKRELDARIESDMQRRRAIVRELNQINFEDYQQLGLDLFECNESRIPGLFPNKGKIMKIA